MRELQGSMLLFFFSFSRVDLFTASDEEVLGGDEAEEEGEEVEEPESTDAKPKMKKIFQQRDGSLKVVLKADTIGRLETLLDLCNTLCNEGSIDVCS